MRNYFAHIKNWTDSRDDEFLKINASSRDSAKKYAREFAQIRGGVNIGEIFTEQEFKEYDVEWHALLSGIEPEIAE